MDLRFLGRSGLQISWLGFGAMTFGKTGSGGPSGQIAVVELEEAQRQIAIAIEAGVNLFDTANIYAMGQSEEILGAAIAPHRKDAIIATKVFGRMTRAPHDAGLSRRHIIASCEDSLRRLGTDWIDLYQVHAFDASVPLEETLSALDTLVTSGKVRYIGCSNFAGWQLMKASATADRLQTERFISQQIQYSLMVRDVENEMLPCGVDQGIGSLIWSPLAQGFLSGKFRGQRQGDARLERSGRLSAYENDRGNAVLDAVLDIAEAHNASGTQVALNWLRTRPGVTCVLFGARTEEQLRDNLAAQDWTLTPEEVERLDRASQTDLAYPASFYHHLSADRNPPLFPWYRG